MNKFWKVILILLISGFAFIIDAGVPFALLVLLLYFEFFHKKNVSQKD